MAYVNSVHKKLSSRNVTGPSFCNIDKARLSTYKSSPMMEVVNQCIQLADDTAIASLLPKLSELLKNSVGLGTKICTSSVLISLIQKHPQDVGLFSGKLLAILYAGLNNKNASLRKSFSVAIGYVVKVSKDSSIANLINKLQHWYFEKDDEVVRETCGSTIYSINLVCPDIIKRHSSSILPFVFFGMHESKSSEGTSSTTYANSNWEEVWQEGTPCTEVGLKLYSSELVEIMQKSLESSSWTIRAQGARTMLTFIEKMATDLPSTQSKAIMTLLLFALPGRTWEGKEVLLKVLSVLCIKCKQTNFFMETDIKLDDVIEAVIRECRKDNLKYKIKAIACLTTISETFETQNFPVLWELVVPIIKKKNSRKEGDDIDINSIQEAFMISFDVLCRCWPLNQEVQKSFQGELCGIFLENIGCNGWQIEVSLLRSIQRFIERWFIFSGECYFDDNRSLISSFLSSLIPKFCQFMSNTKVSTLRIETISVLELLFKKLEECKNINIVKCGSYKDELVARLREISLNDILLDLKSRAQSLLQLIF